MSTSNGGHAAVDLPGKELRVEVVDTCEGLRTFVDAWQRLVQVSAEANVFFEPEVLLPSLDRLGASGIRIAIVTAAPRQNPSGPRVIAGLFPLRARRGHTQIWMHRYAFVGTPLIRADSLLETWSSFLNWFFDQEGKRLLQMPKLVADGAVFRALLKVLHRQKRPSWVQDQHLRARFDALGSAEEFQAASMGRKVRRNLKRQRRLLGEKGELTSTVGVIDSARVDAWVDAFLALEAKGWKGRGRTAMGSSTRDADWFRQVASDLARAGRLRGATLSLDGAPIAMGCIFVSAADESCGAYFKIAFDEAYSGDSAGAVLQLDWIEALHGEDGLRVVDSCAVPGHPMIDHIWSGRQMMQTLWISSGTKASRMALAAIPAAHLVKSLKGGR